ncbi:MAG: hypothetical protein JO288_23290 [Hyphomicrobiales bacterium]|nr:hypothetical protein [Hyphomicrobiales bacterium]
MGGLALLGLAGLSLAGCGSAPPPAPVVAAPGVIVDALVGKWGLASYHKDEDRARTIKEAMGACNRPYVINRGPGGGVMMYLADQKELSELVLKVGPEGRTYLGPPGDVPTAADREVLDVDPNSFTTIWVDPDNAARYGTMVYERCGKRVAAKATASAASPQ